MTHWALMLVGMLVLLSSGVQASTDESVLKKLNLEIAQAEDRGDAKWLEGVLSQELSFRRANGKVVNRAQFLLDVKPRSASQTRIESVHLFGERAVVTCIVTLTIDGKEAEFHNVRLFVRESGAWKLLGWANERVAQK